MNNVHQTTARLWGSELKQHRLGYPDEHVVRFLAGTTPADAKPGDREALIVGFGSGRHIQLAMDFGYRTHGIEIIESAVSDARANLGSELLGDLALAALDAAPFAPASMDSILLWGMIFYRTTDLMRSDLRAAADMLRPDGHLLVNFRTRDNWFAGLGEAVDAHTFLLDDRAGPFAGMTYTFLDLDEATNLCSEAGLTVEKTTRADYWNPYPDQQHSWWVLWCRRADGTTA